jgi:nitrate reductase gamma subunit
MTIFDVFFFVVLPYAAVGQLLPAVLFHRKAAGIGADPAAAGALESERSTWASRAAWFGAVCMVLLHVVPFLFARGWSALIASPARLLTVELVALVGGLLFFFGLGAILSRRLRDPGLSPLRSALEMGALWSLFVAAGAGVATAVTARWGTAWYTHAVGPYLWSLAKLSPDTEALSSLSLWPRVHLAFSFLAMALVPFTTLPLQLRAPLLARLGMKPAAGGAR